MALGKSEYLIEIKQVGGGEVEVTMNGVASSLKQVNTEIKNIKTSSTGTSAGLNKISKAAKGTTKANQDLISSSGLAGATLVETGRFISDLPFGITAVTNNLSQLSTLFITLASKTEGAGKAFKLLGKQLMGPLGFILLFQVVIALIQAYQKEITGFIKGTNDANEATKELTKSVDDLREKLAENNPELKEEQEEFQKLIDKFISMRQSITLAQGSIDRDSPFYKSMNSLKKLIEDTYGVVIDFTDPKWFKRLKEAEGPIDLIARKLVDLQTAIDVAEIKGTKTPAELAQMRLDLFIETQKQSKVDEETYIKEPEYAKLVAKVERAKMDARKKAIDEAFKERGEQVDKEIEKERALLRARAVQERLDPVELATANLNIYIKMQEALGIMEKDYIQSPEYLDLQTEIAKAQIEARKQAVANALKEEGFQGLGVLFTAEETELQKEARKELKKGNKDRAKETTDFLEGEQKRLNSLVKTDTTKKKLSDADRSRRNEDLRSLSGQLDKGAALFGEQTVANKSMRVASATMDTYAAADTALATIPPPLSFIAAAATIAAGIANVKRILSVKVPGGKGGGVSASPAPPSSMQAPDFNVVGASATNQLAESVAGQRAKPVKAFVVGKDISTQQELDRNITNTASFG
jgi:hypothetical protein